MENIIKELTEIEVCEEEIHKIETMNETLKQISNEVKKQNEEHLRVITNIFNDKLKSNPNYIKVVNNFIQKFVKEEIQEEAKEELFLILTGEVLSIFKGITQTKFI